ncbi:hypothetical protein RRG08_059773 [Elysia crispata]|uniref:DNA polymerase V n=1 Tax=Elysia crispata TaxID=231223 RepID=A0AAE1EFZ5_9GAST|nr:hypothetical protein RRG08_059773 [Elysia crispata]
MTKTPTLALRPPKEILDIFWTLADGTDEQRTSGTIKLARLIKESKDDEKEKIQTYCRDRLVKGLSSGRKFARVGFSVALAQLLHEQHLQADDVVTTIQEKLKFQRHEKRSKSEVGGIFLGRAFGFSSVVQSGRLSKMNGEAVGILTNELLAMADKKSYLKAVCNKTLEDIVTQVSADDFGDHIWLKLRDKMKQGWDSSSLHTISLLLTCRSKFPDIVTKKFLKKHWGFPLLGEENDEQLLKATLDTVQGADLLLEKIIPSATAEGRDITSVWNGIGEKLVEHLPEKRADVMAQRQLLGIKIASRLLLGASTQQVVSVCLSPKMVGLIFHNITRKNDPLASATDQLFEKLCNQLKENSESHKISDLVEKLWKLEASLSEENNKSTPRVDLVNSTNFTRLIDMMKKEEIQKYTDILIAMVKGKDKLEVISEQASRKTRQLETCLRQLQHLVTSSYIAPSLDVQAKVLTLFHRLAFFKVNKKVKGIQHCESCINFDEDSSTRKLCESLLFKSLNSISTLKTGHQNKSERDSHFLQLLFVLCQYSQELLSCESVNTVKEWSETMQEEWSKLYNSVCKINESVETESKNRNHAFQLLLMYLGIQMFTDYKTASEMLQDVYVCYEKAAEKKKKEIDESDEPAWVEVLTEVLLHLMSLHSHLGRVVTASVFRFLTDHITPRSVSLIAEVLIPKKARGDDAGGAMVEEDVKDDDDEEEEDEDDDMESDASEESSEDNENNDDEDEDMDDEEEENLEVDEQFRESVRQALGAAADLEDSDDEEKELSDLSDSEMFKLDDMLAEVFRQRKKASGGKKAREEKKAELANFRLRVLDLVENMIKSKRCGDFLLDVLKPLLLLTMRANTSENQALCERAKGLLNLLKSKAKGLKDTVHSLEEQKAFFLELLELAQKTSDPTHMQAVSMASYLVMNLSSENQDSNVRDQAGCLEIFQQTLTNVISRKQSKPHFSFFTSIIEINPVLFQSYSKHLLSSLKDETVKIYNQTLCCSILTSLCKKVDNKTEPEGEKKMKKWMTEAAGVLSQIMSGVNKDSIKTMFMKELLQLMLALQVRHDILPENPFDVTVKTKLVELKSKFNTDLRRLSNKIIAGIERVQKSESGKKKKNKNKRKLSEIEGDLPQKKKLKQTI